MWGFWSGKKIINRTGLVQVVTFIGARAVFINNVQFNATAGEFTLSPGFGIALRYTGAPYWQWLAVR